MGRGLLAQWRFSMLARGTAGAMLFAVPVLAVATLGYGSGISGIVDGLAALPSGPGPARESAEPNSLTSVAEDLVDPTPGSGDRASGTGSGSRRGTGEESSPVAGSGPLSPDDGGA